MYESNHNDSFSIRGVFRAHQRIRIAGGTRSLSIIDGSSCLLFWVFSGHPKVEKLQVVCETTQPIHQKRKES